MAAASRYSTVAIALHWLIALLILLLIPMGWWMTAAIGAPATQAQAYRLFQIHKALGFLVLALTLVRIAWRLGHRPPPLPEDMNGWEIFAARAIQFTFYALLLVLPLSGWIYVSAGWAVAQDSALDVATSWFGLFPIPHIGPVAALAEDARRLVAFRAIGAHEWLAWGVVALVALHAGAALKHHFIDRDAVLRSILPWGALRTASTTRPSEEGDGQSASEQILERAIEGSADPGLVAERLLPAQEKGRLPLFAGIAIVTALLAAGAVVHTPPPQITRESPVKAPARVDDAPIIAGGATHWIVDATASTIRFSGTHAGAAFKGRFADWKASIWFDPADLAGSKAFVDVSTGSARTGDATQEGSLKDAEWFDPGRFPRARFEAASFRALGGNRYEATGTLRVKAAKIPVVLPFTFTERGGVAVVKGEVTLDRTALDLGLGSDATAAWVSKEIRVEIQVSAKSAMSHRR